jgi:DNA-directed RNA polymerase specialized sigma24 family protein
MPFVVQAALMRVVEASKRREGDAPLRASYLWKAAYTATVDEIRRRRRRREVALEEGLLEPPSAVAWVEEGRSRAEWS